MTRTRARYPQHAGIDEGVDMGLRVGDDAASRFVAVHMVAVRVPHTEQVICEVSCLRHRLALARLPSDSIGSTVGLMVPPTPRCRTLRG